jgi:cell division septum initiation protein DivIVA
MRDAYEALKHENIQLRQRVTSLEHDLKEFEVVAKVMEKARKLVVHEELGEVQPNRFKMAANGDLQRY